MVGIALRRLAQLVPLLLALSILLFVWVRSLPGGPEDALLGERATPEAVAEVRRLYGLDRPLPQQYIFYLERLVRLDLGQSITSRRDVTAEIGRRFPATVELSVAAMAFAVGVGGPLGFLAARKHRSWLDHGSLGVSLLGLSIPVFFLALLLKYLFAVKLGWLPTVGRLDVTRTASHPTGFYVLDAIVTADPAALVDSVRHLVLPAVALGSGGLAIVSRITRAAVLDVLGEDYVRTARAKGMPPPIVARRHVLRAAMIPVVTVVGLLTGLLLTGAVLTETVFAWGGIGSWLAQAIFSRDYPVLQGGILFFAVVFVATNLLVDLAYAGLDPRVRIR